MGRVRLKWKLTGHIGSSGQDCQSFNLVQVPVGDVAVVSGEVLGAQRGAGWA